jgi:hypothetical protein
MHPNGMREMVGVLINTTGGSTCSARRMVRGMGERQEERRWGKEKR